MVLSGPAGDDKTGNPNERMEVLYHVPSGQIINWAKDPEGKMQFFIQPIVEDGSVIPELAIPLPLGMKEFFGEEGGDEDGKSDAPGGQKLTEKEKLQKKWAEEDAERKKRWDEEDAERELEWAEKDKELELELEIVELDAKLQELVDQAEAQVIICTVMQTIKSHVFTIILSIIAVQKLTQEVAHSSIWSAFYPGA